MDYYSKYLKYKKKYLNYKSKGGSDKLQSVATSFLLEDAIKKGDLDEVKSLVESGADVNDDTRDSYLPLALASARGHFDIVKFLLDSGALVDKLAIFETILQTSLYIATMNGFTDIVKLLIDRGADVNFSMSNGEDKNISSVLEEAVDNRNPEIVRHLIDAGASVNIRSYYGYHTPIYTAAANGDLEIVQYLLNKNAEVNVVDEIGSTPLNIAVRHGNLNVARILLNADADPNIPDGFNRYPIETAVRDGITSVNTKNIVELLLDNRANPLPAMKSFEDVTGDYISHRIISKRMFTKEKAEKVRNNILLEYSTRRKLLRCIELLDTLDSRILKGIKEGTLTEEQARELGFIERYKEVLENRFLLKEGIKNLETRAEENEEERVKNTNERKRKFGTDGLVHEVEKFLS